MQPTAYAVGQQEETHEPPQGRKNLPHTCGNLVVHIIFSTKQRLPLIRPELRSDLFAYMGGIVRELRSTAIIINGTADHVHMLVKVRPALAAADLARLVKTNSSRWARTRGNSNFAWQTGYGVFSVSESKVADVTRYINGQEEHHKKHSFQEEFLLFLKRNHVSFDERYLWD